MIEKTGNLFDTHCNAIGHGVNCQGVMGAGIAKTFKDKYPHNYDVYLEQCCVFGLKPGGVLITQEFDFVVNLASQDLPGPYAQYNWLYQSAYAAAKQLQQFHVERLALPEIGCGIGGLQWPVVRSILKEIETRTDFEFEVWHYGG